MLNLERLTDEIAPGRMIRFVRCEGDEWFTPDLTANASVVQLPVEVLLGGGPPLLEAVRHHGIADAEGVFLISPLGPPPGRGSRLDSSEIAAQNMVAILPAGVDFGLVLRPQTVGAVGRRSLVAEIAGDRHITTVIDTPAGLFMQGVHSALRLCLVYFSASSPRRVLFYSTPREASEKNLLEGLAALQAGGVTTHGFSIEGPVDLGGGLLPAQRDPRRAKRIEELSQLGDVQLLSDVFEELFSPRPATTTSKEQGDGLVPVLTGRMVRNGEVDLSEVGLWADPSGGLPLEAGDLVLCSVGATRVAEVRHDDLPLLLGSHIIALRPRTGTSPGERLFLRKFLGSGRFAEQLESRLTGSALPRIGVQELAGVRVPVPHAEVVDAFESVEEAVQAFGKWREEALSLLQLSLDGEDLAETRSSLIASSNLVRNRAATAALLDDQDYRISTTYPLPVAYRWRTALAAEGGNEVLQRYLHAQEVLLSYLSVVALMSARLANIEVPQVKAIRSKLTPGRGGLALGDWRAILTEVAELKAFTRLPDSHPFVEVREFMADQAVVVASKRLTEARNDLSHLRELPPGQRDDAEGQAGADVRILLSAAEFLTDIPLIRIDSTHWDSIDVTNTLRYRQLSGDSPIVPQQKMEVSSSEIEQNGLYLADRAGELHLLRPLLVGAECPQCGHWSTFHPDRVLPDGTVEYKSMEHGHLVGHPVTVQRSLVAVGLLAINESESI